MNISLIFTGCLFLFNPCVNVYDVLPDFIGIILILRGLSCCAELNSAVAQSQVKFRSALWVSVAEFAIMAIAAVTLNSVFDGTMLLTFSFAFGVLKCVFLIPAFASLTEGMAHLYLMSGENKTVPDEAGARVMCGIFFAGHALLTVVPELTHLYIKDSGYVTSRGEINIDSLHNVLLFVCLAGSLALGAAFLYSVNKFVKTLSNDGEFKKYIFDRYEKEIGRDSAAALTKSVGFYSLLSMLALLPFLTLKVDLTNISINVCKFCIGPEFVYGILMLVALKRVGSVYNTAKIKKTAAIFTGVSAASYVLSFIYSSVLGSVFMPWEEESFFIYYIPWIAASVVSYVMFALCACENRKVCNTLIEISVGVRGKCCNERRTEIDTSRRTELKNAIRRSTVIMYIYAAASAVCTVVLPFFEVAWAIRLLIGLAMFISYYLVGRDISDEAKNAL